MINILLRELSKEFSPSGVLPKGGSQRCEESEIILAEDAPTPQKEWQTRAQDRKY